jgi:putative SOS response-associated peptidase YedK
MCGRYGRVHAENDVAGIAAARQALWFAKRGGMDALERVRKSITSSYNIKPTTLQPFVRHDDGERSMEVGAWGWRRAFSKAPLINARGEEAATKRTWVVALRERRCVVPASFFYEWKPDTKQPYCFALESRGDFGIGGLWEDTADGPAFILLTTRPNALCAPIHDRMPLILRPEDESAWTDPATSFDRVQELIRPYEPSLMTAWPVSRQVSRIHADGPELIAPYDPSREPRQESAF